MIKQNLFFELEKTLRMESKYCTEDGALIKNAIVEAALALRPDLLRLLLGNEELKRHFFSDVDGVLVFDKVKFQKFVMNKRFLPDSYTVYKNKIGLTNEDGEYIADSREVVLSWPYKDCVLEGGQTKEDAKRNEVFYNEILAPDEINRLTEPKVLCQFEKITKEEITTSLTTLKANENFLIKGNNLLILESLKRRYKDQVKLIYIDPPYNTGNDSFGYNDSFRQSTWLTFMRNRLSIAHELLSEDGTIAISIDNYEIGYLLVLLDEIFGKDNRKNIITVKRASATGAKVINPGLVNIVEYIVLYSKNSKRWKPKRVFQTKGYDTRYGSFIENPNDHYEFWRFTTVLEAFAKKIGVSKSKLKSHFGEKYDDALEQFVVEHASQVVRLASLDENQIGTEAVSAKKRSLESPGSIIHIPRENANDYYIMNGNCILFAKDRMINVDGKLTFSQAATDIWDDVLPNDLSNEGNVEFKKGKKPEKLLSRIMELCTNPTDLVMDFFAGSGTTGAVCLKMKRRFILAEQMNYAHTITYNRLMATIKGENRGVSRTYNWTGGGSFVYCELAKANERFAEEIEAATNDEQIQRIWQAMQETGFLSWKIEPKAIVEGVNDFAELSLNDKKRFLMECLDKNLLYIPLSEIDNTEFGVSAEDKKLNREFYERRR